MTGAENPVEAALREAALAHCSEGEAWRCRTVCDECWRKSVAAISGFHRAIAHHHRCSGLDAEDYEALAMRHDHWAAAVERAGKGE